MEDDSQIVMSGRMYACPWFNLLPLTVFPFVSRSLSLCLCLSLIPYILSLSESPASSLSGSLKVTSTVSLSLYQSPSSSISESLEAIAKVYISHSHCLSLPLRLSPPLPKHCCKISSEFRDSEDIGVLFTSGSCPFEPKPPPLNCRGLT